MTIEDTAKPLAARGAADTREDGWRGAFPAVEFLFLVVALLALAWFIRAPLEDLTGHLRSEYQPIEILSSALVLAGFFTSLDAALAAGAERAGARAAGLFAALFAAIYLGETNALPGPAQPFVALPLVGVLLWRSRRERRAVAILAAAVAFFGAGFLADTVDDLWRHAAAGAAAPTPGWLKAFSRGEELFEACAEIFLLWAALESLWSRLGPLCAERRAELLGGGAALLFVAAGNGLLQAGYEPSTAMRLVGFALSASGLAAFLAVGARLARRRISFGSTLLLYAVLVIVPSVAGKIPEYLSAAIWLPALAYALSLVLARVPRTR